MQRGVQLFQLLDRCGEVRVRDEHLLAAGDCDPGRQRSTLAAIRGQSFETNLAIARGGGIHHLARAIGAAVVDDDQLVVKPPGIEVAFDLLDGSRQPLLLVIGGDHDAELGSHGSPS